MSHYILKWAISICGGYEAFKHMVQWLIKCRIFFLFWIFLQDFPFSTQYTTPLNDSVPCNHFLFIFSSWILELIFYYIFFYSCLHDLINSMCVAYWKFILFLHHATIIKWWRIRGWWRVENKFVCFGDLQHSKFNLFCNHSPIHSVLPHLLVLHST